MTAELYTTISYVSAGLCVLFFLLAVVLFFKLKIKSVIGDLSGSTARKAVKEMKEHNASGTGKRTVPAAAGSNTGKTETDRTRSTQKADADNKAIAQRKRNVRNTDSELSSRIKKDADKQKEPPAVQPEPDDDDKTTLLDMAESDISEAAETSLLDMQTEDTYESDDAETSLLDNGMSDEVAETTVLGATNYPDDDAGETSVLMGDYLSDDSDEASETTVLASADYDDDDDGETTMLSVFNGVELEKFSDYDEDYAETTLLSVRKSDEWTKTIRIIDEITYVSLNELID